MWNDFCETARRIEATTKRLEKSAIIGEFFVRLSDEELALAVMEGSIIRHQRCSAYTPFEVL